MQRFILTGAPGAGKTALLRALEGEGFGVVEEAATDVIALSDARGIAEHWTHPGFIEAITALQTARRERASALPEAVQIHDRGPPCVLALAEFLGLPVPPSLSDALALDAYERRVLFVRLQGYVTPTAARRIGYEEALRFEAVHEAVYRRLGYELIDIAPGALEARAAAALKVVRPTP
ncbi:MAG: ATPase [Caulobacter sp.]|nr:ATPase [Caulobacter sp.]